MDRGGHRLHGNHWSSLLDGNRASTAMASVYDGKIDTHFLQRLFRDDTPLQHQAFKDDMYSELNVDDPT